MANLMRNSILILAAIAVALFVLGWAQGSSRHAYAGAPAPDMSIAVEGVTCDTKGVNPTTCQVPPGSQFTIVVSLNDLVGLPDIDVDTKSGYVGLQTRVAYSAGLSLKNRTGVTEVVWPDCATPAEVKDTGSYLAGCVVAGGANESVFTGPVTEVDFTCDVEGIPQTITLVHGLPSMTSPGDSFVIVEDASVGLAEAGPDVLTVTCAQGVGGIAKLPDVAKAPLASTDSSGRGYGTIAGLAAMLVAGGVAVVGVAWYARRRPA